MYDCYHSNHTNNHSADRTMLAVTNRRVLARHHSENVMKTYTLWVSKYNCTVKIVSDTKNHAMSIIRHKLALTWLDDIKCLGINL